MDPHDTTRPTRPDVPGATAPPTRTFGPQGPTLGDLIDAYLQDYLVRQFRSHSTARRPDRPSHRVLRPRRAGRRADHAPDSPVSTRPARRRGGHRHHQPRDLGPPPHGHPRRPLGLARHRARLPRPPPRESRPARASSSTPNTSPSAPTSPPRGRTSSMWPTTPGWRKQEILGLTWEEIDMAGASSGSRRPARKPWWGGCSRSHNPSPRPWRGGGLAAPPTARSSSTATGSPSAAGARRGARPARRPGYRPASSTIAGAPPPAT